MRQRVAYDSVPNDLSDDLRGECHDQCHCEVLGVFSLRRWTFSKVANKHLNEHLRCGYPCVDSLGAVAVAEINRCNGNGASSSITR